MHRTLRTAAAGIAALTLAATAACTGPSSNEGDGKSSINVYLYQEPVGTFSPLAPASGPDMQVMSFVNEGLLGVDPKYKLQPMLASKYTVSPDAKTFTFTLRSGLKWSDGKPFTSKDVLFTYQRMADPDSGSATAANYANSTFSAPNSTTFVIKAKKANAGLPALIGTVYIMPEHILGKVAVKSLAKDKFFTAPKVGMGPYTFVEYKTNQFVHLRANKNYRSPAKINDVYLKPMSSDVATAQLGNGGIDIASYSPADIKTVQGLDNVSTQQIRGAGFVRIALNQSKAYFKDVRVRQAFLYGVNRKAIVDKVLFGKAAVQNSDFFAGNAPSGLNQYSFDQKKARDLLKAAGWDKGRTIKLMLVAGQRDRDATATIVQNQLGDVGVKVSIDRVQPAQITPRLDDKSYDMLLYGGGNYAVDSSSITPITSCATRYPAGPNQNFFCDPTLDKLMQQGDSNSDPAQRKSFYDQAALRENSQADLFWLYNPFGLWAVNKRVSGFQAPGSQEFPFWKPGSWTISK